MSSTPPKRKAKQSSVLSMATSAFIDGLIKPSLVGFWAMLVGLAIMLGLTFSAFSYAGIKGHAGPFLARSSLDSSGLATHKALQISQCEKDRPILVVLGTSIIASALASEAALKTSIQKNTGESWCVAILATALQSPVDQITLIETTLGSLKQADRRAVIVLGIDVSTTGWSTEQILKYDSEPRLGLRSDWADAEIRRLGGDVRSRSSSYIIENERFFVANAPKTLLRFIARRPAQRRFDLYTSEQPTPVAERKRALITEQILAAHGADDPGYLSVLNSLAEHLKAAPMVNLALVHELPSPGLVKEAGFEELVAKERAAYVEFSDSIGADFLPLFEDGSVNAQAYYDDFHIGLEQTRQQLIQRVTDHVAQVAKGWK